MTFWLCFHFDCVFTSSLYLMRAYLVVRWRSIECMSIRAYQTVTHSMCVFMCSVVDSYEFTNKFFSRSFARGEKIKRKHTCSIPPHDVLQFHSIVVCMISAEKTNKLANILSEPLKCQWNESKMILKPTWWARYECVTFSAIRYLPDKNKRTHKENLSLVFKLRMIVEFDKNHIIFYTNFLLKIRYLYL